MADSKTLHTPPLLVQDVMTAVVHKVTPDMKVYQVIEMLTRYLISGAPVVDQNDIVMSALSEGDLAKLAIGITAAVTPVGSDKSFPGQVWQVAPVIDPQTRQGRVRIALPSLAP